MKVSVIIPVYNGERYVGQAIASALKQTLKEREVIVVDDGSTDGSAREIRRFGTQIVYLSQANRGVCAARNAGIRQAKGEYVAFLDQDDLFFPEKLATLAGYLDAHPRCGMVYGPLSGIDAQGRPATLKRLPLHAGDVYLKQFRECFISPSMAMCRRALLFKVGLFDERFSSEGEDYDLFLRLAREAEVGVVPEVLGMYRVHAANTSRIWAERPPAAMEEILRPHKREIERRYRLGWWHYRRRLASVYRAQAQALAQQGRPDDARRLYLESLRHNPLRLKVYAELWGTRARPGTRSG